MFMDKKFQKNFVFMKHVLVAMFTSGSETKRKMMSCANITTLIHTVLNGTLSKTFPFINIHLTTKDSLDSHSLTRRTVAGYIPIF